MAAQRVVRRQSSCSLSTIYSRDELDAVDAADRRSDEVDGAELDVEVFTSWMMGGDEVGAATDNEPTQPSTARRHQLQRQHAVMIDSAPSPADDAVAAHVSADRQESAEASQVTVRIENYYAYAPTSAHRRPS